MARKTKGTIVVTNEQSDEVKDDNPAKTAQITEQVKSNMIDFGLLINFVRTENFSINSEVYEI